MPKIKTLLPVFFLISMSSCVSILSKVTDDQAWQEYFIENQLNSESLLRSVASSTTPNHASDFSKALRKSLNDLPFRDFLIQSENRDAYQSKLVLAFDQVFGRVKSQGIMPDKSDYSLEQQQFLEARSFEKMMTLVDGFHRMFLSGVELRASKRAVELAGNCESESHSQTRPHLSRFQPFSGGVTYLPREVYACINQRWSEELNQLMSETIERLGIEIRTESAKNWIIQRQLEPIYAKVLNDFFAKKLQSEESRWSDQWTEIESSIDWKSSLAEVLSREVPKLRQDYQYLNIEARLTARFETKK